MDPNVLIDLTGAINRLGANRVPPPAAFNGTTGIRQFFDHYEEYCTALYGNNQNYFLQLLPTFVTGKAKEIVTAFGSGATITYDLVKQRVIAELTRSTLGSNPLTEFYAAIESLLCYSIRLQSLVDKLANVAVEHREVMVKAKFMNCLPPSTIKQISMVHGGEDNTTLQNMVRLGQLMEDDSGLVGNVNLAPEPLPTPQAALAGLVGATAMLPQAITTGVNQPIIPSSSSAAYGGVMPKRTVPTCFICGEVGHYSPQCSQRVQPTCFACGLVGHYSTQCTSGSLPNTASNQTPTQNNIGADSAQAQICYSCGQPGHFSSQCTVNPLQCFECNAFGHLGRDCAVRRNRLGANGAVVVRGGSNRGRGPRGNWRGSASGRIGQTNSFNNAYPNNNNTSGANAVEVGQACVFCGVGYHLLKDCDSFTQRFMPKCVWCNDPNHASFECTHKPKPAGN